MPTTPLSARLSDQELLRREHARPAARRPLSHPATAARALALAICEVEAGLRSASQLERICHLSLWEAVADRLQRASGPPVTSASILRMHVQELQLGLVDAVAVVCRGPRSPSSPCGWRPCRAAGSWLSACTDRSPTGGAAASQAPFRRLSTAPGPGPRPGRPRPLRSQV